MGQIYLALVWHQHQPYYKDLVTGQSLLPWVRLHGIKDYIGLTSMLREVPELRQTINLVPSLIVQIEEFLNGGTDKFLEHTTKPADGLTEDEVKFILDHFFMAHWENMINVHPRYGELLSWRSPGRKSVESVWKRFSTQDLLDLQVWATLAWFHPTVLERDEELSGLITKGRNYTEGDKAAMLAKQLEVLGQVIPSHRELQESGQLEVTTTPFFHPILPLLWDMELAHVATPGMLIPQLRANFREDVAVHVSRAVECYREHFGCPPKGMWPSEGSVAPQTVPALAEAGIQWIATDEDILALSIGTHFDRDSQHHLVNPDLLYRPWRISADGAELSAIFRDHYLSDMIGFKYQWLSPGDAVGDFIHRLDTIRRRSPRRDHLVSVILDGENAWESYAGGGVPFLRALYRELVSHSWLTTVRVSDYLAEHPPTDRVERLFSGSWISHNFATWVGHGEKNMGWEYLDRTRLFLERETAERGEGGREELKDAWEELYIGEGSDWFWWYGDDHYSGNDEEFDRLFREHLKNVYRLAGAAPADFLNNAIIQAGRPAPYSSPRAFLSVELDGRPTSYFEWASAGHYSHSRDGGTMQRVSGNVVSDIYFGFDEKTLFLRLDLDVGRSTDAPGPAPPQRAGRMPFPRPYIAPPNARRPAPPPTDDELVEMWGRIGITVSFSGAVEATLTLDDPTGPAMTLKLTGEETAERQMDSFALRQILELAIPFEDLNLKPDDEFEISVEIRRDGAIAQRAPESSTIRMRAPTHDFERLMWQA